MIRLAWVGVQERARLRGTLSLAQAPVPRWLAPARWARRSQESRRLPDDRRRGLPRVARPACLAHGRGSAAHSSSAFSLQSGLPDVAVVAAVDSGDRLTGLSSETYDRSASPSCLREEVPLAHSRIGSHGRPNPAFVLCLLLMTVALVPLAYASPPDQTWVAGIYDEADFDDVVWLLSHLTIGYECAHDANAVTLLVRQLTCPTGPAHVSLRRSALHSRAPPTL